MLNRKPKVNDFVFAVDSNNAKGGMDAKRGLVGSINGDTMTVAGPHGTSDCRTKGAIVIPKEDQTDEERGFIDATKNNQRT